MRIWMGIKFKWELQLNLHSSLLATLWDCTALLQCTYTHSFMMFIFSLTEHLYVSFALLLWLIQFDAWYMAGGATQAMAWATLFGLQGNHLTFSCYHQMNTKITISTYCAYAYTAPHHPFCASPSPVVTLAWASLSLNLRWISCGRDWLESHKVHVQMTSP